MACTAPKKAWRPLRGGALQFREPERPWNYEPLTIGCRTCITCRAEEARQWTIRLLHEAQQHDKSCMITLTYDQAHEPANRSLRYQDLQKFWKRLRKANYKFKYFAVGEYGDKSQRPHYHACVYGEAFDQGRILTREEPLHWTHPELQFIWGMGQVDVTALTPASAAYVCSYVMKKLREKQQYVEIDEATGELVPLEQPKRLMSDNLARTWFDMYFQRIADRDNVVVNQKEQKPPRAYDRWLQETQPTAAAANKDKRKKHLQAVQEKTSEERYAHARNAHARTDQKRRSKTF